MATAGMETATIAAANSDVTTRMGVAPSSRPWPRDRTALYRSGRDNQLDPPVSPRARPVPGEFLLCPQIALIFPVTSGKFPDTPIKFPVPIHREFVSNLLI